jgi:hypothetical protein
LDDLEQNDSAGCEGRQEERKYMSKKFKKLDTYRRLEIFHKKTCIKEKMLLGNLFSVSTLEYTNYHEEGI